LLAGQPLQAHVGELDEGLFLLIGFKCAEGDEKEVGGRSGHNAKVELGLALMAFASAAA